MWEGGTRKKKKKEWWEQEMREEGEEGGPWKREMCHLKSLKHWNRLSLKAHNKRPEDRSPDSARATRF